MENASERLITMPRHQAQWSLIGTHCGILNSRAVTLLNTVPVKDMNYNGFMMIIITVKYCRTGLLWLNYAQPSWNSLHTYKECHINMFKNHHTAYVIK